jgi:hypothetical protein
MLVTWFVFAVFTRGAYQLVVQSFDVVQEFTKLLLGQVVLRIVPTAWAVLVVLSDICCQEKLGDSA